MGLLQELAARLAIPGMPAWTGLLALLVLLLVGLAYLLMPFAVFGVKGRLETIEAQLDELQAEIRSLRLGGAEAPRRQAAFSADDWVEPPSLRRAATAEPSPRATPPVPPPAAVPDRRGGRAEPKLDWPDRG